MASGGQRKWAVGECTRDAVRWLEFEDKDDAYAAFQQCVGSSALFNPEDGIADAFCCYDSEGVDGAVLLQSYAEGLSTNPNRTNVKQAVIDGRAPFVPPSRGTWKQWLMKKTMSLTFTRATVRYFGSAPFRNASLCYFEGNVQGHVALTFDDAPCRFGRQSSRVRDVMNLLKQYNAHATFMVIGNFLRVHGAHRDDVVDLLRAGHELGNHCEFDRSYEFDSPEDFERAVVDTNSMIKELQHAAEVPEDVKWFRSPHGRYTRQMDSVLKKHGMTNVMCDTYASCPVVQDGEYIGNLLAQNAQPGGILLLHMPERGHREWCLQGLQVLLEGLQARNLCAITVGQLHQRALVNAQMHPGRNQLGDAFNFLSRVSEVHRIAG
eukprot:TRINITY_DN93345_c0_g1_i1.p1 TRINITY_DN93345_c0_g1~~TRINITY_DN93345_c0_g1_i1.p1  ORF type:complete len:378 (+),score=35.48 TRINITY_DN93345_c0_g1_i1:68-1201(+)